jgi:hypothetical protein
MRLSDADALHDALKAEQKWVVRCEDKHNEGYTYDQVHFAIDNAPTIETNLILPERMERGDCYEVGETIVVMNHDDYYDLLCKSMENEPKHGEWIGVTNGRGGHECSNCHAYAPSYMSGDEHLSDYCPSCGARMFPTQMSER